MKRSTAISRLGDVVDALDRAASWSDSTLVAAFAFGSLLDGSAELDRLALGLVVDEPSDAVPWLSRPAQLEALAATLGFTKLPVAWRWRPAQWPVWNHAITRAVRFWSVKDGRDEHALAALAAGDLSDVVVEAPANHDELVAQLQIERDASRRYLGTTTQSFYDRDWRRGHRGDGVYPEDHLWDAAHAFLELDDALRRLDD